MGVARREVARATFERREEEPKKQRGGGVAIELGREFGFVGCHL